MSQETEDMANVPEDVKREREAHAQRQQETQQPPGCHTPPPTLSAYRRIRPKSRVAPLLSVCHCGEKERDSCIVNGSIIIVRYP